METSTAMLERHYGHTNNIASAAELTKGGTFKSGKKAKTVDWLGEMWSVGSRGMSDLVASPRDIKVAAVWLRKFPLKKLKMILKIELWWNV